MALLKNGFYEKDLTAQISIRIKLAGLIFKWLTLIK